MTSVHTMSTDAARGWNTGVCRYHSLQYNMLRRLIRSFTTTMILVLMFLPLTGCLFQKDDLTVSPPLRSPYPAPKIWAVAPLANESGVSTIDTLLVSDQMTKVIAEVEGINVLPVQRVLDGLRAMNIARVQNPTEAQSLARLIGADGLIVGSIIAYDPYKPPTAGLTLQLYTVEPISGETAEDIRKLEAAPSDQTLIGLRSYQQPIAGASGIFDASENSIQQHLQAYAEGRIRPGATALDWERYLVDMDLYMQYVGHRLVERMLIDEQHRLFLRQTDEQNQVSSVSTNGRRPPG